MNTVSLRHIRHVTARFALAATLAAAVLSPAFASPAHAAWEALSGNGWGWPDGIATTSPVKLTQYSLAQDNGWAYFAFKVNGTSRSIIVLYDLNDPTVNQLHQVLLDAFRHGKSLRWMRNTAGREASVSTQRWQGYTHTTSFPVRAGDKVELIIDG